MQNEGAEEELEGEEIKEESFTSQLARQEFYAMESIGEIMDLAKGGDRKAVEALHKQARVITRFLNSEHAEFSEQVTEWPILVRRSKSDREEDVENAMMLKIGGSVAGGKKRPDKFDIDSQKGFALKMLKELSFARAMVRNWEIADLQEHPEMSDLLGQETGFHGIDQSTWNELGRLEPYGPASRKDWIGLMVRLLLNNAELIPESLGKSVSSKIVVNDPRSQPKLATIESARGRSSTLKRQLTEALANIDAVPDSPQEKSLD